ncbi:hypothetical protein ABT282_13475 [Streptomyces sp. NPDC000927]|uniref:hypothetical protein n=1 Tax=Streptomyces sp. NPDC000927 TaxID=3154371 RepID=UPI00332CCC47
MMRRHIRLSAVLLVVVLALTGFSTGRGHSGKSKSGSGGSSSSGGGCSSSKKSNNDYSHSDYGSSGGNDDYDYGSSSGSSGGTAPSPSASDAADAYVFRCAQPRKGKRKAVTTATVRLTANAAGPHTYEVDVTFLDAMGNTVDTGEARVKAEDGDARTVSVRMDNPRKVSRVKKCRVEAELTY